VVENRGWKKKFIYAVIILLLAALFYAGNEFLFPGEVAQGKLVEKEEMEVVPESQEMEEDGYRVEGDEEFYRGKVRTLEVVEEGEAFLHQQGRVEITSGAFEGHEIEVDNYYEPQDTYTFKLEEGMEVILVNLGEGGFLEGVHVHDVARDRNMYIIVGFMALLLVIVGGEKGFRGLLSLVFTLLFIFYVLLPLILRGYHPLWITVLSAVIIIFLIMMLIGGINQKSFIAIAGTACGVVAAGILAYWAGEASHLTGFGSDEAQMLHYMDKDINVRYLLYAGIIIGALGAVTDVGISVASAAEEIRQANPSIKFVELFKASLNVGRDVMATMSNTIILAYVGAAIPLLLLITGMGTPWLKVINMDIIASEVVRSVAVTLGFVVTVPVTALLAGYVMGRRTAK